MGRTGSWAPLILAMVMGCQGVGCTDHRAHVQSLQMSSQYIFLPSEDGRVRIHVLLNINSAFFRNHFDDDRLFGNQQIRLRVSIANGVGFTTCLQEADLTDGVNDITIHAPAKGQLTLEVYAWGGPYDGASDLAQIDLGKDPEKTVYDFSF